MSGFDYLSLIKRQAKALAKTQSVKLSAAQKSIAVAGGFAHYHELQKVALKNPDDIRLMRLALQTDDLKEVVYGEGLYEKIDHILEDELSTYMAETNADGFCMDQLTVDKVSYDQTSGVLSILADIIYGGDQKPDRPFSGTTFYVHVIISLFRQVNRWELHNDKRLQILEVESDQDRDWQQQRHGIDSLSDVSILTGAINAADLFSTDHLSAIESSTGAIAKALEASGTGAIAKAFETNHHLSAIENSNLISDVSNLTGAITASDLTANAALAGSIGNIESLDVLNTAGLTSSIDRLRKKGLI